jgi:hypothetical protein
MSARLPRWLWLLLPAAAVLVIIGLNELAASWQLERARQRYEREVGPVEPAEWFPASDLGPAENGGALLQRLVAAWPLGEASDALLSELAAEPAAGWSDETLLRLAPDLEGAADWLRALERLPATERSSLGIEPYTVLDGSLPEDWLAIRRVGRMAKVLARDSIARGDCGAAVTWTVSLERVAAYLAAEPLVVLQLLALDQTSQLQRMAREVVDRCGAETVEPLGKALDHHAALRQGFAGALGAEGAIGHRRALEVEATWLERWTPGHPKRGAAATLDVYRELATLVREAREPDALRAEAGVADLAVDERGSLGEVLRAALLPNLLEGVTRERLVEAADRLTRAGIEIVQGDPASEAIRDRRGLVGDALEAEPVAAGLRLVFPRSRAWLEDEGREADASLLEWGIRTVAEPTEE